MTRREIRRLRASVASLREAVRHLEEDNLDLRRQLEAALAVRDGRPGPPSPVEDLMAVEVRASAGPVLGLLRRARHLVLYWLTLAGRAFRGDPVSTGQAPSLPLDASGPPVLRLPDMAVVVEQTTGDELEARRWARVLSSQTDPDVELVVWDRSGGAFVRSDSTGRELGRGAARTHPELREALTADMLVTGAAPAAQLPTLLSSLRRLMATERLQVARVGGVAVVSRPLWGADDGVDREAMRRLPAGVVGKLVPAGQSGWPATIRDPQAWNLRRVGPWLVSERSRLASLRHAVAPSPREVGGRVRPRAGGTVMVLLDVAPVGGVEHAVSALLSAAGLDRPPILVCLAPVDELGAHRLAGLASLSPHVHQLGGVHAPELWPSLVEELAVRWSVGAVVNVGGGEWLTAHAGRLRAVLPGLRVIDHPVASSKGRPDADLYLACSVAMERALLEGGLSPVTRLPMPTPWPRAGQGRRERVREELGLPHGTVAVVALGDLVPERRPEDLVELARRLGGGGPWRVLLAGEGPLATAVAELARWLDASSFSLIRPRHQAGDILAAADVVCSTAELDPCPVDVVTAAALGRPVVAYRVGDLEEVLPVASGRGFLVEVADLDGLEAGVRAAAETAAGEPAQAPLGSARPRSLEEIYRRALLGGGEGRG